MTAEERIAALPDDVEWLKRHVYHLRRQLNDLGVSRARIRRENARLQAELAESERKRSEADAGHARALSVIETHIAGLVDLDSAGTTTDDEVGQ